MIDLLFCSMPAALASSTSSFVFPFTITPSGKALAADISGLDLSKPLNTATVQALQAAWDAHLVLRFRGQSHLSVQDHIRFSAYFGPLDQRPQAAAQWHASTAELPLEVAVISNLKQEGKPIGALGDGEAVWHADMTYKPDPPKAALLLGREVPDSGGDTHFANMYAAYETLPADLKEQIAGLHCVHDASRNSTGQLRLGFADNTDPRLTVGAVHPLVRVDNSTGRQSLYLGRRRNAYVQGLSLEDSEALLDALWAHATQPHLTWSQQWQVGDLVAWNNNVTLHRRDAFDASARRYMHRTQVGATAAA